MGIGKSTITQELGKQTLNSVYLDGDWCWMINPFIVNNETKQMVIHNIQYLLNSFIKNTQIETIFFCWVMDEQVIVDKVLKGVNKESIDIYHFSLIASPETLRKNIKKDIKLNKRTPNDLARSLERLQKYNALDSIKVDTSEKNISEIVTTILRIAKLDS